MSQVKQRGAVPAAANERPEAERASLVLERVSDAFVALDRDWHYTVVNHRAASIFGRRPEDMVGKHIWTEFPEGVGQPFYRAYQRAMATQEFTFLEDYYAPYDRWFENRIYPSADGLSIFFHDITDRKRAEALLIGQNRILERIAAGAPLNESLDALLRFLESQAKGVRSSILLLDDDGVHVHHAAAPSLPEAFLRAIDGAPIGPRAGSCGTAAFTRKPVVVQDIARDPLWDDYRQFALPHGLRACWSTPIFDQEQHVLGTFAMYYDAPGAPRASDQQFIDVADHLAAIAITRSRAEQRLREHAALEEQNRTAQEATRMKSEFLASMSHELRTPLNAIIGFSEFLSDEKPGPLNPRQREYLGDILSSGRHLLQLINDVLDLAKVEAGKLELRPVQLSLAVALEDACAVVRAIADKKGVTLHVHPAHEVERVRLDPQRFRQVLFNLLANAVKFTPSGGRVDVLTRRFDDERFEVRVCDTGVGIRREDIGKLFQEFSQLDPGTGRRQEGTGLGLALTRRLVESQNGTIGVESEVGRGSTFFVVMPVNSP